MKNATVYFPTNFICDILKIEIIEFISITFIVFKIFLSSNLTYFCIFHYIVMQLLQFLGVGACVANNAASSSFCAFDSRPFFFFFSGGSASLASPITES